MQGWHDEAVDVSWIFSGEGIGKSGAVSSLVRTGLKLSPNEGGCFVGKG